MSLHAQPTKRAFWTMSAWVDPTALQAFFDDPTHRSVMQRFRPVLEGSRFVSWTAPGEGAPSWDDARQRLAAVENTGG